MASVNGRKIYKTEVDKYYANQTAGSDQQPQGEQATSLRLSILDTLIETEILMRRAEKLGLLASDEEVDRKLNEIKSPYTAEEFQKRLDEKKITVEAQVPAEPHIPSGLEQYSPIRHSCEVLQPPAMMTLLRQPFWSAPTSDGEQESRVLATPSEQSTTSLVWPATKFGAIKSASGCHLNFRRGPIPCKSKCWTRINKWWILWMSVLSR